MQKQIPKQMDFITSTIPYCDNFTWGEFLWLPRWELYCFPDENQYINIKNVALKLQQIRHIFDRPIKVTSGLRPKSYNKLIRGARSSYHMLGMAVDFQVKNENCDHVRAVLEQKLERLGIRMEAKPGSSWCHIDMGKPSRNGRYFKP